MQDPDNISKQVELNPSHLFQQTALPYAEILNTWFMRAHGKSYVVVGQPIIKGPLLTYFDVYDDTGKRADQDNGKKVYTYMSKLLVMNYLESLQLHLNETKHIHTVDANRELESLLATRDQQAGLALYENSTFIDNLFNILHGETNKITQLEHVLIDDLGPFLDAWSAFWDAYKQRLETLFLIREQIIKKKQIVNIDGTPLEPIYIEAEMMFELFVKSIPINEPLLKNVDDLIELHWELGRAEEPGLTKQLLTPFELFSTHLFKHASRWSFWFVLPLLLILAITDVVTFQPVIVAGFITLVIYYAHNADKVNLLANLSKRLKDYRQAQIEKQPVIQQKYHTVFLALQEEVKQQEKTEQSDEFMTILAIPGRLILGLAIFILIIGWGLLSGDTDSQGYGYGYMIVGITLVIIRILLPFWPLVQRKFQLSRNKLIIGKSEHYLEHINHIEIKRSGKVIKLSTTQSTQEMIFKVKREDRTEATEKLKQWCILHDVELKM